MSWSYQELLTEKKDGNLNPKNNEKWNCKTIFDKNQSYRTTV